MLAGKTVIVTGANGALGRVLVGVAEAQGARVVGLDRVFDAETAGRHTVDLADARATRALIAGLGPIDCALNVAGGFAMGPAVHDTPPEAWSELHTMNVATMLNVVAAVVPGMIARRRGSIVNVGALAAREGQAHMGAYCAAKSTVMRLTESLAKELREHGINVNAVLPSIIDTPANRRDMPGADFARWVQPADVAAVVCFLASNAARAVHGALVPVAGLS